MPDDQNCTPQKLEDFIIIYFCYFFKASLANTTPGLEVLSSSFHLICNCSSSLGTSLATERIQEKTWWVI